MIAWLFLLLLLAAEVAGLTRWLRREYYPFFFSGRAPLIYAAALALDFILTWLVSFLITPGGTFGTAVLALLGVTLVVVVAVLTVFFRWVVRHDMNSTK